MDPIIESVHKEYERDESNKTQKRQVSWHEVLDASNIIRTFLSAHDDDEAMRSLLSCEARAIKLLRNTY